MAANALVLAGSAGQIIGLAILAYSIWPVYQRARRKNRLVWVVKFSRHIADLFDNDHTRTVFTQYSLNKHRFAHALDEIRKHKPSLALKESDYILQESQFQSFYGFLEENHGSWIASLNDPSALRIKYTAWSAALIFAGCLTQIVAILASEQY